MAYRTDPRRPRFRSEEGSLKCRSPNRPQVMIGESDVKPRTFRLPDQPQVVARHLGPRTFDQVPPAELAHVMREAASSVGWEDLDTVFWETMARFGVRRMGSTVRARLQAVVTLARTADPP